MLKLYFGNINSLISSALIVIFGIIFWQVLEKRSHITKWGLLVLVLFVLGLAMSMMSGMKDKMGTDLSIIPLKHWIMAVLCILGALAFLVAILALFIRKPIYWEISFFILSAIIIMKTIITESYRIYHYLEEVIR